MSDALRSRLDYYKSFMVWPVHESTMRRAAWYSLARAEKDPTARYDAVLNVRLDSDLESDLEAFAGSVPGLSTSGAVRLLLAVGLENMAAVRQYAPEVFSDAVRDGDGPLANSARLASEVAPLTSAALRSMSLTAADLEAVAAYREDLEEYALRPEDFAAGVLDASLEGL